MKKNVKTTGFYLFCFLFCIGIAACTPQEKTASLQLPNPWTDCQDNLQKAAEIAGFSFELVLSNYQVKAMKNMIEITYPLDEKRNLTARKSDKSFNDGDLSGIYINYPIKEPVFFDHGQSAIVRRDANQVYVLFFQKGNYYYSASCIDGMSFKEAKGAYDVITTALPK